MGRIVTTLSGLQVHVGGYRPDADWKRGHHPLSRMLVGDDPMPPNVFSVESLEGPILDQNRTGSCTGHGTSQCLEISSKFLGCPLPFRPGPRRIYENGRLSEEKTLTDEGAEPADIIATIAAQGIDPLVMPSPQGFETDVDASNVDAREPAEPPHFLEPGPHRVDNTASNFLTQLRAGMVKCGAAGIGIFVDSAFQNYTPASGPVRSINTQDPNGGGHWLALSSYRLATAQECARWGLTQGTFIFRGPNSWTPQWGDLGHYELTDSALLTAISDAYLFNVSKAMGPNLSLIQKLWTRLGQIF